MATPPLLEVKDLNVSYFSRGGETPAVVDFNLTVNAGESVGLIGESGCGKSTVAFALMRYLGANGVIKSGQMKFLGRDIAAMTSKELRSLRGGEIAMVYQEPFAALNPVLKIVDQLIEAPMAHEKITKKEAIQRAEELLSDVRLPDLERVMASYPHQLSGGQRQRVVIAMALLTKPKLILLDEPTTALDVTVEAAIVNIIADLRKKYGMAIIFVSHNMGLIVKSCERVCVMYSGQVVEEGEARKIFIAARHPYTRGLLRCIPDMTANKYTNPLVPIRGQLPLAGARPQGCYFGPRCDFFAQAQCGEELVALSSSDNHLTRCNRWQEIDWASHKITAKAREKLNVGDTALEVVNMQKYYELAGKSPLGLGAKKVRAVEDLSFDVKQKQIVAIVGESGCGKSTFAKALIGLESGASGKIIMAGENLVAMPVEKRSEELVSSLQMIFQDPNDSLNPAHTIGKQIARAIYKLGKRSRKAIARKVEHLLDLVKLPRAYKDCLPQQLSGGQKQRVGIARAFAGQPKVVVADEPVSALDVSVQAAVVDLLLDIQAEHDTALLFITHDLSLVRYLADKVIVMYLGRVMEQGFTDDIFEPPYHPYTEALLSAAPVVNQQIKQTEIILEGELPKDAPKGCPFASRCHRRLGKICDEELPPARDFGDGHEILCHIDAEELRSMRPVFASKQ